MGARLKEARTWMGLTLKTVGERMNLSRQRIHDLESYDYLSDYQIERISVSLGVDKTWLRTGEGPMFMPGHEVPVAQMATQRQQQMSAAEKKARIARIAAERAALKQIRAEYVRNLRLELGISQKTLGEAIGVKQNIVSAFEREAITVSDEIMERIEAAIPELRTVPKIGEQKTSSGQQKTRQCGHGRSSAPFITVCRSGLLISKGVMEKLGDCGYVKVYYDKNKKWMVIMETIAGENGAQKLNSNGSSHSNCKLNNVGVRKVAEKMLGFKVGDGAWRVEGTWMLDEGDKFWLFDMSKAEAVSKRKRG